MASPNDHFQLRPPSLNDVRGTRWLMVWGDVGQWLVVDEEAARLMQCFERQRRVGEAIEEVARTTGKSIEAVTPEALSLIDALCQRGLLGKPPFTTVTPPDPLGMANLTFNITNRCNLSCPWCYNARSSGDEIPIAELVAWLRVGADYLGNDAAFLVLGGEPFLNERRLLACVQGVRECLEGEILVSTNGTHWPTQARMLAAVGTTVQLSLDSATAKTHNAIRGEGVFEKAIACARELVDANVRTVFSMVLRHDSVNELEAYFELAEKIGVHEVRFIPLRQIGRGTAHTAKTPDLCAIFDRLIDILKRRPEWTRLMGRDFFSVLMTVCRFSRLRDNCGIGRRCLFIDADGSLFPCPNHRDPVWLCGNVRTMPLKRILEDSKVLQDMRQQYHVARLGECCECGFRFWCAGDCRAEARCVSGEPTGASPYCHALQQIMPQMFWLIAEGWNGLARGPRELRPWS